MYMDLTHDGQDELLVLEMEEDRMETLIQLHNGDLDPDRFATARVTVLRAGESCICRPGRGRPTCCGTRPTPAAAIQTFSWRCLPGGTRDVLWHRVTFPVEGGSPQVGDADRAAVDAFLARAEELLEDAKPVIIYDAIHDPVSGTDRERRFAYLDELFTTY